MTLTKQQMYISIYEYLKNKFFEGFEELGGLLGDCAPVFLDGKIETLDPAAYDDVIELTLELLCEKPITIDNVFNILSEYLNKKSYEYDKDFSRVISDLSYSCWDKICKEVIEKYPN